jgi:hypothetical protein
MPTTINEDRRERRAAADPGGSISPLKIDCYFGVVSWLAAIGTVIASVLVVTYPTMTDIMWLFSQVP